jgi:tRNA dimethylallyltransferase
MLYFKALREGLSRLPQANAAVRAVLDERARRDGWPALHAQLARVDPTTAARLSPHDAQRIQRALEVHALTQQPLSALQGARERSADIGSTVVVAIAPADRGALHKAIAVRFDAMLRAGLVDEVRQLRERHALEPDMPSMRCVGYRQVCEYLDGRADAAALRERGIAATRQLAKRQLTWLRRMDVRPIDALSRDAVAAVIADVATRIETARSG